MIGDEFVLVHTPCDRAPPEHDACQGCDGCTCHARMYQKSLTEAADDLLDELDLGDHE